MLSSSPNLDNGNDNSNSTQGKRQVLSTAELEGAAKLSERFVYGNHTKSNWQDPQEYATSGYSRKDDSHPDMIFLEHLSNDLAQLLHRRDISDCCLKVQDIYMSDHRCILGARSNVFANVISNNMNRLNGDQRKQLEINEQNGQLIITINKTDKDTMRQVVLFMYTAKCDINKHNALELLNAAGRYDIKSLKVYSGSFIAEYIELSNVLTLLKSAYDYDNAFVRQKCIEFFIDNAKEVMAMKEPWEMFAADRPNIIAELLYWNVNKAEFHEKKFQ
ncbi:unnamed protein product [Rotaria socialis]|uniref:BTB domain-containing protein n=1 Tax=Rotaria socialis TaxID=392032 RepID=A0A820KSB5_9BILA|nr:unnamed protein product [Rotaria socialis]CAF4347879.1 unnamed protein product [Rotaria socialis]